jgi:hypothetical protein
LPEPPGPSMATTGTLFFTSVIQRPTAMATVPPTEFKSPVNPG